MMEPIIKPAILLVRGDQRSYSYQCTQCGTTHQRQVKIEKSNTPFSDVSLLQRHYCIRCGASFVTIFHYAN
jgi:DNA-directed RNA polymerase subunit RPC12/RpoP